MTENKEDWVKRFYAFELTLFLIGMGFLYFGYTLTQDLFNYLGVGFFGFGMVLALIQKRGGKTRT